MACSLNGALEETLTQTEHKNKTQTSTLKTIQGYTAGSSAGRVVFNTGLSNSFSRVYLVSEFMKDH